MDILDAFINPISGLGTSKDKAAFGRFQFFRQMNKAEIEALYRSSWLGGTIIDAPCDDMTREWRSWHAGSRQEKAIMQAEAFFNFRTKINLAMKMARLYGGSAILIGDGASDPSKELDILNFPKGGLQYLHVLSRWELWSSSIQRDPLSKFYGEPEYYMLNAVEKGGVQIHPSRIIRFIGIPILELSYSYDGWGFSIYERIHDEIRNVTAAAGNMATMTYEGKLDVIKIPNLTANVQSLDYRNKLLARFAAANLNKSVHNALILDKEEEWDQKEINLSNMPEGIRTLLEIVAGAANMPVTRLLGTSPKGLNATGQSELRNYYDMLAGKQEIDLRPGTSRLDNVLVRHALGVFPDGCTYTWNPLWQMTEAEKSTIATQKAQATQIYSVMGIMPPNALREGTQAQLIQDGTYPGLEDLLTKYKDEPPAPLVMKVDETGQEIDTPSSTPRTAKADAAPPGFKVTDAEPRTLYVSRPVRNGGEILRWAKAQGIPNLVAPKDLHVTIAFSRDPVDWFKTYDASGRLTVDPGGPRVIEPLGDDGALVLMFASESLTWRWEHFRNIGASWDYEEYQPHITLTWNAEGFDYSKVKPYQGRIVFGPERFAEIDENWKAKVGKSS